MEPAASFEEEAIDPLLPQAAVCDRHQDRPARRLVAAPDGAGDSYLCGECFAAFNAGGSLPFLRHSPRIRTRQVTVRRRSLRRTAREKAGSKAQFLRALFAHADVSLALIDESGKIITAVGPDGGVLGYTGKQRSGILDFVHPDDLSSAYAQLEKVTRQPGGQATFQIRARHADGSTRLLAIEITNRLEDELLRGIVLRSRDVTRG
jgi:PAS domain S-box-containing protein